MTTTNDAAERLLTTSLHRDGWVHAPVEDVRAALAAERRDTVERIPDAVRQALHGLLPAFAEPDYWPNADQLSDAITTILDAEAER